MDKENTGCWAWILSFKQSCSERWARFRNRLRRRFYARRGQTIDPSTIVNETGTKDMVITKSPYKTNKVLPESLATPRSDEKVADNSADDVSLSPSIISQIADKAVTVILSHIVLESKINQSAIHKDMKEFIVQKSLELLTEELATVDLLSGYNC